MKSVSVRRSRYTGVRMKSESFTKESNTRLLRIWKAHFYQLLVSNSSGDEDTSEPMLEDGIECIPPSQNEVKTAITRLKNNKAAGADGLPAELFKAGGDMLIRRMHQLVSQIWIEKRIPDDWNLSILFPAKKETRQYVPIIVE